jgi:SAM-dependent methyltransferase
MSEATRSGTKLNIGSGQLRVDGYTNVDREASPAVDVVWDLMEHPWPFENDSIEGIITWHFLEHLHGDGLIRAMEEIHRILKPGGEVYIKVPFKERGPYNQLHHHVFSRNSFAPWISSVSTEAAKPNFREYSLQNRFGWFRRIRQEVVTLYGFPVWHIIHYLPWTEGLLFERDVRGPYSPHIPSMTLLQGRELREWLAKV